MVKILVVFDGISDKPCKALNNLTPLEAASTPNLDYFASKSNFGSFYPINEQIMAKNEQALVSLLGYDIQKYQFTRGPLEAYGNGIEFNKGDLVLSTNFSTIKDKVVIDRKVGRSLTNKEAEELTKFLQDNIKLESPFEFRHLIGSKGILIFKGDYSDNITSVDPYYKKVGKFGISSVVEKEGLSEARALDPSMKSRNSAKLVNEFVKQSHELLKDHSVNIKRNKNYLLPTNIVIPTNGGINLGSLPKRSNWSYVSSSPMEKGILKLSGAELIELDYPKMKNSDAYENLFDGLKEVIDSSIKALKKEKVSKFIIYFKETAIPGKDNKPLIKKEMIELIDKRLFSFLKTIEKDIELVVTSNCSLPCELREYSNGLVPFLHFGKGKKDSVSRFTENEALKGSYGKLYAKDVLKTIKFL